MKKFILVCLVLILAAVLFGCCDGSQYGKQERAYSDSVDYSLTFTHVTEFHLRDGTRCVTTGQGGVACEWKHSPGVE